MSSLTGMHTALKPVCSKVKELEESFKTRYLKVKSYIA